MQALSKSEVNGFAVEIYQDEDADSPRGWTHGCELVLSRRGYDYPNDAGIDFDAFGGWEEIGEHLKAAAGALVVLPVYAYIHSGIVLRAGQSFSDPWDSGTLGLAYVTAQNWKDTQGTEWTGSEADREMARRLIAGDVETYSQYLNGEVYGYVIKDFDGEEVDSLWGMYGSEYAEEEAKAAALALEHEPKCTGTLNRQTGQVEHAGACPLHPHAHDAGWQHGCDDSPIPGN
jgi:hypothetical protein